MNEAQLVILGAAIALASSVITTILAATISYFLKRREKSDELTERAYFLLGQRQHVRHMLSDANGVDESEPDSTPYELEGAVSSMQTDPEHLSWFVGYYESSNQELRELTKKVEVLERKLEK